MLVDVDLEVVRDDSPLADVELPLVIQEWLLDVFLNDPRAARKRLVRDELFDLFNLFEDFDASPLVLVLRLDEPHVLRAVLPGHTLFFIITFGKLPESSNERLQADFGKLDGHEEGRRRCVEDRVAV